MALARLILFYCPPDKLSPFSPKIVSSPFLNEAISLSNPQILIIYLYFTLSNEFIKVIFFLILPLIIQGS